MNLHCQKRAATLRYIMLMAEFLYQRGSSKGEVKSYRIEDTSLVERREDEVLATFPYSDIRRVRLSRKKREFFEDIYYCQLTTSSGQIVHLNSESWEGLPQDNAISYASLMMDLHRKLLAHREAVEFRAGWWPTYLFRIAPGMVFVSMLLFLFPMFVDHGDWLYLLLSGLGIAGMLYFLSTLGIPTGYAPDKIPAYWRYWANS